MATVTLLPSGRYQVRIRRLGCKPVSQSFIKKTDADAWARKTESELERGEWMEPSAAATTSLSDALTRYLTEVSVLKKGHIKELSVLRTLADEKISKLPLSSVESSDVSAIAARWRREGYAAATIVRRLAVLQNVYTVARKQWGFKKLENPVEDVSKPRINNARTRRVSNNEIDMICRATESDVLPDIVRLAVETAMRREELTKLLWTNVSIKSRILTAFDTKNGDDRGVPLSPAAIRLLASMKHNSTGRVFSITPDAVSRAFARAVGRARADYEMECKNGSIEPDTRLLIGLTFHDLRREATSRMAATFQAHELAKITGHKDLKMVLRYYQADPEALALRMK